MEGIDFRLKEFLGICEGKMYGSYKYPDACDGQKHDRVMCKTSELIIGPDGNIYRCHADLYLQNKPIGHILGTDFEIEDIYRPCDIYGYCNPCDIKNKFDRFQQTGHCSVNIRMGEK
jgi:radical SAM protein with 4Fe4S-binding SPASM domain